MHWENRLFYAAWFAGIVAAMWALAPHLPRLILALGLGVAVWLVTTAELRQRK